jgi:hypothetical protein
VTKVRGSGEITQLSLRNRQRSAPFFSFVGPTVDVREAIRANQQSPMSCPELSDQWAVHRNQYPECSVLRALCRVEEGGRGWPRYRTYRSGEKQATHATHQYILEENAQECTVLLHQGGK